MAEQNFTALDASGRTCAGASKGVKTKKGGEAWALSQSSKDPAKVTAAKQALKGKLSKPMLKKSNTKKTPQASLVSFVTDRCRSAMLRCMLRRLATCRTASCRPGCM